jgi:hypothetical protein
MKTITDDAQVTAGMAVSIVYEDFATGMRAKEWLDRLCRQMDQEMEFKMELWRFDLLPASSFREEAAAHAAAADMIILSAHRSDELPASVKAWMNRWLSLKDDHSTAFVLLLDGSETPLTRNSPLLADLQSVAQKAGLALFYQFCGTRRFDAELDIERIAERAERSSVLLEEMLHRNHCPVRWGIND